MTKYELWNETDGILASPKKFPSKDKALAEAKAIRQRFSMQGYYATATGERIEPGEVRFAVKEAE